MLKSRVIPIDLKMTGAFLIRGRGMVLVDAGNPGDHEDILSFLEEERVNTADISLVLITHGHPDHFGGLKGLMEKVDAPVAVQKRDAGALRRGESRGVRPVNLTGRVLKMLLPSQDLDSVEPDVVVEEELDLSEYGVDGKVIHTPGHTSGSVSVILDSGAAVVGDLVMSGFVFGRGSPKMPPFLDDVGAAKASIMKVLDEGVDVVHTSHSGKFRAESVAELLE